MIEVIVDSWIIAGPTGSRKYSNELIVVRIIAPNLI